MDLRGPAFKGMGEEGREGERRVKGERRGEGKMRKDGERGGEGITGLLTWKIVSLGR